VQRSYLEANWRNGVRLLKLINDLLDLAKMGEGFLRLRPERTDLQQLLQEIVGYSRPLAGAQEAGAEPGGGPGSRETCTWTSRSWSAWW
jgi:signal transduction histidine kinase